MNTIAPAAIIRDYDADGQPFATVRFWSVMDQRWITCDPAAVRDADLAALPAAERATIATAAALNRSSSAHEDEDFHSDSRGADREDFHSDG